MASDLEKTLGNKIVRWLAGNAFPAPPAGLFVSLWNGNPKSGGTEVTTTIRTAGRVAMAVTAPAENDTDNSMLSSADVDFGDAAGAATISYLAVHDAASAGKRLASKPIPGGAINVGAGSGVKFDAGDLSFVIGS